MDTVISELCYRGKILQRNYKKMTILWSFSYTSFVKFWVNFNIVDLYPHKYGMKINFDILTTQEDQL